MAKNDGNKIPTESEVKKNIKAQEEELKEQKKLLELEKKEKADLEKALAKAKSELEESKLRSEIEQEELIKRARELAKSNDNSDVYIKIRATVDKNWPGLFQIGKNQQVTINQKRFDFLVKNVGNFVAALNSGELRVV